MNNKYSEEIIQKTINFIKTNHPELEATREQAISILDKTRDFGELLAKTAKKERKERSKKLH